MTTIAAIGFYALVAVILAAALVVLVEDRHG